jgi:hypothetical protein
MSISVTTNNVPRDLISAFELSAVQYAELRKEFDYMNDADFDSAMFFKYRKQVYSLAEFLRTEGDLLSRGWQGICSETAYSGVLVKIVESCRYVVVGRYCD